MDLYHLAYLQRERLAKKNQQIKILFYFLYLARQKALAAYSANIKQREEGEIKLGKRRRKKGESPSRLFLKSSEWKCLRKQAIEKYGAVCMRCGSTDLIQVDHIKPRSKFPDLVLDINNLQILCWPCNSHKNTRYIIDYRPKAF